MSIFRPRVGRSVQRDNVVAGGRSRFDVTFAEIFALMFFLLAVTVGAEPAPVGAIDWKARAVAEIPPQFAALRSAIGHWQGEYTWTLTGYPPPGAQQQKTKVVTTQTRYFHNDDVGGMKLDSLDLQSGDRNVIAINKQYNFSVEKARTSPEFYIRQYSSTTSRHVDDNAWLFAAYTLWAAELPDLIKGKGGELKAATPVESEGKQLIRLEFNRIFSDSNQPYALWALVDPENHWAITSYEQQISWGVHRGNVSYDPEVTEVAFPKHIVEQDVATNGGVAKLYETDFTTPKPCHAAAAGFTLEAFNLEPPNVHAETGGDHPVYKYLIINCVLVGTLAACGWYLYAKRKRTPPPPPRQM